MKRLRLVSLLLAIVLWVSALNAESLDRIIASAKENSPSFKNTQLAYQDGQLALKQLAKEDKTIFSVGGSYSPVAESTDAWMLSPTASVTSKDGKTNIGSTLALSSDYKGNSIVISPSISASHTFDFSGVDTDLIKDINYSLLSLNTEVSYVSSEYAFEQGVINTISSLMSALKGLDLVNKNLSDMQRQLDNLDLLKTVSTDSTVYQKIVNNLSMLKNNKIALEKQYENAKANYKVFTGLDWDGVDELPEPNLDVRILDGGNSSVIAKSLMVEQAQLELDLQKAAMNPVGMTLSGGASGEFNTNPSITVIPRPTGGVLRTRENDGKLAINAEIAYSASNWTIGASHTSSWTFNEEDSYAPSLTISGKWTNGSLNGGQSKKDDAEIQKYQNAVIKANNDYIAALTDYTQKGQALAVSVMQWQFEKSECESNLEYLESVLDSQKALFEKGLIPESDVSKAQFDLDQAMYDWNIMMLEGLSLERDLKIYAL